MRLGAVAENFQVNEEPVLFSVCAPDFSVPLRSMAEALAEEMGPLCYSGCPADANPTVPGLQPDCTVVERVEGEEQVQLPTCEGEFGGEPQLPIDADACVWLKTGDQRAPLCQREGLPMELEVLRREGAPRRANATLDAWCTLSEQIDIDCGA